MAKELPYFQFEPAEYLTKDVSFCSLEAQGLFINICSYYWQRNCELTKGQLLRRLNYENALNELISEGVIDLDGENILIKFLDIQREKAIELSSKNRVNGAKGGRPKKPKRNPKETQTKPTQKPNERHKIKRDNIKQDKTIEDNILLEKETKEVFNRWVNYRKEIKKPIKSKQSIDLLIKKFNENSLAKCNEVVNASIENGWQGLFWNKEAKKENTLDEHKF